MEHLRTNFASEKLYFGLGSKSRLHKTGRSAVRPRINIKKDYMKQSENVGSCENNVGQTKNLTTLA